MSELERRLSFALARLRRLRKPEPFGASAAADRALEELILEQIPVAPSAAMSGSERGDHEDLDPSARPPG